MTTLSLRLTRHLSTRATRDRLEREIRGETNIKSPDQVTRLPCGSRWLSLRARQMGWCADGRIVVRRGVAHLVWGVTTQYPGMFSSPSPADNISLRDTISRLVFPVGYDWRRSAATSARITILWLDN